MIVFPNCKINLGLQVLRKRSDGYHDLQTVFYPISLHDALEVIESGNTTNLHVSGNVINTEPEENICIKAFNLLKKDFTTLPTIDIYLHKTIPSGAGLGGGSADGAFMLLLLNSKFNLKLSESDLLHYALQLGSDCPFFIKNVPSLATGRGEGLRSVTLTLSEYSIVLVNPGINVSTAWAFSQLRPEEDREELIEMIQLPLSQWKENVHNDFEEPIFRQYPEIKNVKESLYRKGAIYASMTGSGSTVYGLFEKQHKPDVDFPAHYFHVQIDLH